MGPAQVLLDATGMARTYMVIDLQPAAEAEDEAEPTGEVTAL